METFDFDAKAEQYGMALQIDLQFMKSSDKQMRVLSCTIHNYERAVEYAFVIGETTLKDVIVEFLKR